MVLDDLKKEHPDAISVIRLNGMLHSDDNCAMKEIARQLCLEHQLSFSKMASSDDNTEFMIDMLRECGLAHKTIIFVLEEFDLFAQGKQRLLYSLLDAMQSLTSQAIVIGVSCRLDADQLLEKRVRSRFSHRKLIFLPSSVDSLQRLMEHLLMLPEDSHLPTKYVMEYNARVTSIFSDKKFKGILNSLTDSDATTSHILRFLFRVVSYMDMDSGLLSMQSFMNALSSMRRQPKMDSLQGLFWSLSIIILCRVGLLSILIHILKEAYIGLCTKRSLHSLLHTINRTFSVFVLNWLSFFVFRSLHHNDALIQQHHISDNGILIADLSILELYILVCMHRLEDKEHSSYNFTTIMKEYKSVQDAYRTSDNYSHTVCFRAFEHLLDRELISFADKKGKALEYRPVKLLISSHELAQSLKLNTTCPAVLQKLLDRERYM
ncbi:hypothetical protein GUJ93_ZPchr0001g33048 [Zizania palustris]|uniref:Origin of replication complex subunit 4 n=1 Tax=Zizania palustris TaxID=103762 RepID=A0A8J5VDR0_ZIZPA|nr:hypothetical protein GUJ93_ZPchr0001g33048 [Zizania palustris]